MRKTSKLLSGAIAATVIATGCTTQTSKTSDVIDYWLWDSAQQPGYEKCAAAFEEANPGVDVRITQYSWDDYWSKLTAGFIADQAPDVFTNHLIKYPQFVDLEVLVSLDDLAPTKDLKDTDYAEGLAELWKGQDGKRYGAPKDWDTIAYFYDKKVTEAAGITQEQLNTMTWNPEDGGTFEQIIAHLTVDANGVRGDEPGFDKNKVAVYGLASDGAGGENLGQTQWAAFAYSVGDWMPLDRNPWGREFNLDDPKFQAAIEWYFGLADKGYMPRFDTFSDSTGSYQQVSAGKAVLGMNGSWMISSFAAIPNIELGIAPSPIGPSGQRASAFNGLADSVTRFAENPQLSAQWVDFLAGQQCQMVIAEEAVVFPARPEATDRSFDVRAAQGIDLSAFTIHLEEHTTKTLAVTTNAADIAALTRPAFEAIYIGQEPVSYLTEINDQVNQLLDLTES